MPAVVRKAAIRNTAVGIRISIGADTAWTVVFSAIGAALAVRFATGVTLRPNAHAIADRDTFSSVFADSNDGADDFVADAAGITGFALSAVGLLVGCSITALQNK